MTSAVIAYPVSALPTPTTTSPDVETLTMMFPGIDKEVIQVVLESNGSEVESAVSALLEMASGDQPTPPMEAAARQRGDERASQDAEYARQLQLEVDRETAQVVATQLEAIDSAQARRPAANSVAAARARAAALGTTGPTGQNSALQSQARRGLLGFVRGGARNQGSSTRFVTRLLDDQDQRRDDCPAVPVAVALTSEYAPPMLSPPAEAAEPILLAPATVYYPSSIEPLSAARLPSAPTPDRYPPRAGEYV